MNQARVGEPVIFVMPSYTHLPALVVSVWGDGTLCNLAVFTDGPADVEDLLAMGALESHVNYAAPAASGQGDRLAEMLDAMVRAEMVVPVVFHAPGVRYDRGPKPRTWHRLEAET